MQLNFTPSKKQGNVVILIGMPGSRKTTLGLSWIAAECVIIVSESTHEVTDKFNWLSDSEVDLARAAKTQPPYCIRTYNNNPQLWQFLRHVNCPILIDDAGSVVDGWHQVQAFKKWLRHVRKRGQKVIITTHRTKDDLPPLAYTYAKKICYVGPTDFDEVKNVYGKRDVGKASMTLEEFYERIKILKPFDYRAKNELESVFVVKDT
jgi:hypothetical protein